MILGSDGVSDNVLETMLSRLLSVVMKMLSPTAPIIRPLCWLADNQYQLMIMMNQNGEKRFMLMDPSNGYHQACGLDSMKNKCINLDWLLRVQGSYEVLMLFSLLLFAEMMLGVSASFLSYLIMERYLTPDILKKTSDGKKVKTRKRSMGMVT